MKKILYKTIPYIFWFIVLSWIVVAPIISDDPPKPKKKIKKDTIKIDIQQMKDINEQMVINNRLWDSLIMQIDTLKKKR